MIVGVDVVIDSADNGLSVPMIDHAEENASGVAMEHVADAGSFFIEADRFGVRPRIRSIGR